MKHYYDTNGDLTEVYDTPIDLLNIIHKRLDIYSIMNNMSNVKRIFNDILNNVIYDYDLYVTLNLNNETFEDYMARVNYSPDSIIVYKIMVDIIQQGFIYKELHFFIMDIIHMYYFDKQLMSYISE